MLGKHEYQPELFVALEMESLIPANHILRKIDKVLDLSFIRELSESFYSSDQGRPSIDPEIFVRMILLESLFKIESDRQLCEEIGYNLAYRWFCRLSMRDKVPDHSSLTRIRDRLGEQTYQKIFEHVIGQCKRAGIVGGEHLMADGSYIKANASLSSMRQKEGQTQSITGQKFSNQTHVSTTDPEATVAGNGSDAKLLRYKTHHIVDAQSRVILDCHVTSGNVREEKIFMERLEGLQKKHDFEVRRVTADRGYGTGENLACIKELGIESNIQLYHPNVGTAFSKQREKGFVFDSKNQTMTCPQGLVMVRRKDDQDGLHFALPKKTCGQCPQQGQCLNRTENKYRIGKRIAVAHHQPIYEEVWQKEKTSLFFKNLRDRFWKVEGIFAEAKTRHGLGFARYRGRWKVQAQVYIVSTVQNLKRLAFAPINSFKKFIFSFINSIYRLSFIEQTLLRS